MTDNNENLLNTEFFDPIELTNDKPKNAYVPKFEKDLAKSGSIAALSAEKKTSSSAKNDMKADDTSDSAQDKTISSEKSNIKAEGNTQNTENKTTDTYNDDDIFEFKNITSEEYDEDLPYITKDTEQELNYESIDFSNDYDDENYEMPSGKNIVIEDMSAPAPSPKTSSMTTSSQSAAKSLLKQMMMDDLAVEMNTGPKAKLDELSDEYTDTTKKTDSLVEKDFLDKDEKQFIKDRLKQDIGYRPTGLNQKASANMYNSLIAEKKIKESQKGLSVVILLIILGLINSAIIMLKLNWNDSQMYSYLSIATAFFSILMLVKSKPCKISTTVFFAAETILLIGPGLIKLVLSDAIQKDTFPETMAFFAAAIIISTCICVTLFANKLVNTYSTTNVKAEKRKLIESGSSAKRVRN